MKKTKICLLLLAFALFLCACTPTEGAESSTSAESTAPARVSYTVEVLTEGGMPLEGVRVDIYTDQTCGTRLRAAETDENGKAVFEAERSDSYAAVLSELPLGLETKEYYAVTETTQIVAEAVMPDGSDLSGFTMKLGDIVCDCTVTATDGTVYTFSELLATKKALVLNFWYIGCEPCKMEFPYLQGAYESYSEDVAVLAINPYDGTNESIASYALRMGLTFPMASGDAAWQQYTQLTAYPTTVVIDRYGMICMIHRGSVTQEGVFEQIFAHFTADDYTQQTFRNLTDLF